MFKFNGLSSFKVYMSLKPIKYGFKAYLLTEAKNGYVMNWQMFIGKKQSLTELIDILLLNYKNQGFHVSFDRFYSTVDVIKLLTSNGFRALGSIMKKQNIFQ